MILSALAMRNKLSCPREINHITVRSPRIRQPLTLAVVSDLHAGHFEDVLPTLSQCDAILIVGDLVDRHHTDYALSVQFLRQAPEAAPTFYALGNHEWKHPLLAEYWPHVEKSRVTVLDNRFVLFGGIALGALSSQKDRKAERPFVREMALRPEFRLMLCHHPEDYAHHVKPHAIDLTLAGHAHGGQVRLGNQGVFAPGQGLLPKLTSGFYDNGRLLVSRGMTNATWAPRINCPCELIILHLEAENG